MTNSIQKGKAAERELASELREMGFEVRRGVQYSGGPDSPDVVGIPGVHIEVKRTERFDVKGAQTQASNDAGNNIPSVWHRYSRRGWWVMVPVSRLIEFAKAVLKGIGA